MDHHFLFSPPSSIPRPVVVHTWNAVALAARRRPSASLMAVAVLGGGCVGGGILGQVGRAQQEAVARVGELCTGVMIETAGGHVESRQRTPSHPWGACRRPQARPLSPAPLGKRGFRTGDGQLGLKRALAAGPGQTSLSTGAAD